MKLNYKVLGQGEAFIILHGLYGMSDNWLTIGKKLAENFQVFLLDLRNHGKSPHSLSHTYNDMVNDLMEFFIEHKLEQATIMGHSMGGKVVMNFALKYPERVSRLIVADIAPRAYATLTKEAPQAKLHLNIINTMLSIDFSAVEKRQDVAEQMLQNLPDKRIVQFLLKNLKKNEDGKFYWALNVEALRDNLPNVLKGVENMGTMAATYPALFLKGENSNYILDEDMENIRQFFPYAEIVTIFDAGHWLHAEQPEAFINAIKTFIFD